MFRPSYNTAYEFITNDQIMLNGGSEIAPSRFPGKSETRESSDTPSQR